MKQQASLEKAAELSQMIANLEKVDDESRRHTLLDSLCSVDDILSLPLHPDPPSIQKGNLKVDLLRHQVRSLSCCYLCQFHIYHSSHRRFNGVLRGNILFYPPRKVISLSSSGNTRQSMAGWAVFPSLGHQVGFMALASFKSNPTISIVRLPTFPVISFFFLFTQKSGYEDTTDPTPSTRSRCFVCWCNGKLDFSTDFTQILNHSFRVWYAFLATLTRHCSNPSPGKNINHAFSDTCYARGSGPGRFQINAHRSDISCSFFGVD